MKKIKYYSLILLIFMVIFSVSINKIYANDTGSISIVKLLNKDGKENTTPVSGSIFGLVKISDKEISNEEKEKLVKELESMSIEDIQKKYETYGKFIISDATDNSGQTTISNLKIGSYYVIEIEKTGDILKKSNSTSPFIVNIEKTNKSIKVYTKSTTPSNGDEISVKKVWVGSKLKKIQVYLYANNKKINEVELSDTNDWSYTFKSLNKKDSNGEEIIYTIKEQVPDGYISDIKKKDSNVFIITNTENNISKNPPKESGRGGSIIRTGDWTIYLIIGLGIILMALGYKVYKKPHTK